MINSNHDEDPYPPVAPTGEAPASNDPKFVMDCLSILAKMKGMGDIEPGPHQLTQSAAWGLVFRVDFTINGEPTPGGVNRLICWKDPKGQLACMFAIGQDVAPLS